MSSQLPDHGATTPKKSKQYSYANRKLCITAKCGHSSSIKFSSLCDWYLPKTGHLNQPNMTIFATFRVKK